MAETREGGVYKVGDEYQNANGEKVSAPAEGAANEEATGGEAGEDYPHAELLRENGFTDWNAVREASDEDLLAVDGIGPSRLREIRAHKA